MTSSTISTCTFLVIALLFRITESAPTAAGAELLVLPTVDDELRESNVLAESAASLLIPDNNEPGLALFREDVQLPASTSTPSPKYEFVYQVVAGSKADKLEGNLLRDDDGGDGGPARQREDLGPHEVAEFGHAEVRDGATTRGRYFVELPDGRLQTVDYYVIGKSGYVAKISYS